MNIEDLHIFCQVVEEGNFSKVARMNFLSQPAITQKMNKLEEQYEVALFQRAHGKITLTQAAHIVYPFAKEIVSQYRQSNQAIHEYMDTKEQTIHIGASYTIGEYMLPQILGAFNSVQASPIKFQLLIKNTPTILDALERDEIEIACVEGDHAREFFTKRKMAHDTLVPVIAARHPLAKETNVSVERFLQEKIIWREKESSMRQMIEAALDVDVDLALELESIQAIKSATAANLGVAILPRIAIANELELGILHMLAIPELIIERPLWMVQKKQHYSRALLQTFQHYMIQQFQ